MKLSLMLFVKKYPLFALLEIVFFPNVYLNMRSRTDFLICNTLITQTVLQSLLQNSFSGM